MNNSIAIAYVDKIDAPLAKAIAKQWQFDYVGDIAAIKNNDGYIFVLQVNMQRLELLKRDEHKLGAIAVDFVSGAAAHRRQFGGGRGQEIAKAVGLKHGFMPSVLDATAGLGRDAFVLASLGCQVTMLERMPVVAALLADGLTRGELNSEIADIINHMQLQYGSLLDVKANANRAEILSQLAISQPDVVYLDPMYPHREKSAAIKKEMRVFQSLIGADNDADELLPRALAIAKYRVVVKRPNYAEPLANITPSTSIKMKKNRFDVYVNQGIPKA